MPETTTTIAASRPASRRAGPKGAFRHAVPLALLVLAGCAGAPAPREARVSSIPALTAALGRPVEVRAVAGAELTLDEIRRGTVEPGCAEAGLVMASMRVRRRPDGAQEVEARCGRAFAMGAS